MVVGQLKEGERVVGFLIEEERVVDQLDKE